MLSARHPLQGSLLAVLLALAGCGETARPNIIPGDAGEVGVIADDRATTDAPEDTGVPIDRTVRDVRVSIFEIPNDFAV